MNRAGHRIAALTAAFAFARPGNWFVSKLPPLLAVAYLAMLRVGTEPVAGAALLGAALLSICCVAIYGHVVNDIFDLEADRLAGKVNRLATMRPLSRWLLVLLFLAGGFLPALAADYSASAMVLLALNYLWPTIYSLPVIRLKERGLFGVACDALGSHVTPTLFILALFGGAIPLAVAATLWAAVLGLKGILHHQIADRENDLRSGLVTFATRSDVGALQRFLTRFNLWVELPVSTLLAAIAAPGCPLAVPALLLYAATELAKYELGFQFALSPDPATIRASVPFANEMFYVLWLPMAAALQLGIADWGFAVLPLLHGVVFRQPIGQLLADWRAVLKQAALAYLARFGKYSDPPNNGKGRA